MNLVQEKQHKLVLKKRTKQQQQKNGWGRLPRGGCSWGGPCQALGRGFLAAWGHAGPLCEGLWQTAQACRYLHFVNGQSRSSFHLLQVMRPVLAGGGGGGGPLGLATGSQA